MIVIYSTRSCTRIEFCHPTLNPENKLSILDKFKWGGRNPFCGARSMMERFFRVFWKIPFSSRATVSAAGQSQIVIWKGRRCVLYDSGRGDAQLVFISHFQTLYSCSLEKDRKEKLFLLISLHRVYPSYHLKAIWANVFHKSFLRKSILGKSRVAIINETGIVLIFLVDLTFYTVTLIKEKHIFL